MIEDDKATLLYYDEHGKKVKEGSPDAVVQYLSNDPNRPGASKADKADDGAKAKASPDEDKSVKSAAETK